MGGYPGSFTLAQWNPSVCIRGRRLRVQDVVPSAEQEMFTAGWEGGRQGREEGKAGSSKAGRGRSCLQKQEMLLKPWFGTDLWNWEATGSPCFQPLRWR